MDIMIYKKKWPAFFFLFPAFFFMAAFLYYPFAKNIYNAFFDTGTLGTPRGNYIGFDNFKRMWFEFQNKLSEWFSFIPKSDSDLIRTGANGMGTAFFNTVLIMILTIFVQVGFALVLSLMVDSVSRGAQIFRTVYFFPIVISATALGLIFNFVFNFDYGMLNRIIEGMGMEPVVWSVDRWFFTMAMPVLWQYVGYYFVIIATGINNISDDVNEAAAIDGATGLKRIRYITLPLIYNTLMTCLTLAITGALKVFDLPWTMFPQGVPSGKSYLTGTYMYDVTFGMAKSGYGAAIGVFIVLFGMILALTTKRIFKEKDY